MRTRPLFRVWGRLTACGGLLCALAVPAAAGTVTGQFPVQIAVTNGAAAPGAPANGGLCINQALSQASQATVTVVCSTNQFVSIQPFGDSPFVGTHGGAYRFVLWPELMPQLGDEAWLRAAGTVTTMQVIRKKKGRWHIAGKQAKNGRWEITEIQISY